MAQIIDKDGQAQEFVLSLDHLKAAMDSELTLPQYLNSRFKTDEAKYGQPYLQLLTSSGVYFREDRAKGIRPTSVKQALAEGSLLNPQAGGPIVRPDGSQALTLSGRLLFATTIQEMVSSVLLDDFSSYYASFNGLVASTQTVPTPRVDIPTYNFTAPRGVRSAPVAQLALPPNMVSISLSSKSMRLPTYGIALEIAHQALEATTLDIVGILVREQAEGERGALIDEAIKKIVDGDDDWGMAALPAEYITQYDSAIAANGVMTQKAWVKWLREKRRQLTITHLIGDLDVFLAIQGRTGRPTKTDDEGVDTRLNSTPTLMNPGIPQGIPFFDVDTSLLGANVLVGLDKSKGVQRWVYTGASYEAMETYVMKRSDALRLDWSEMYTRVLDQGFRKVTLTTS